MLTTVHPYGAHSLSVCLCACVFLFVRLCVSLCAHPGFLHLTFSSMIFVKTYTTSVWSNWTDSFWLLQTWFWKSGLLFSFSFFPITLNKSWKRLMGSFLCFSLVGTGCCWASRCISKYWQKRLRCELFSLDGYKVTQSWHVSVSSST